MMLQMLAEPHISGPLPQTHAYIGGQEKRINVCVKFEQIYISLHKLEIQLTWMGGFYWAFFIIHLITYNTDMLTHLGTMNCFSQTSCTVKAFRPSQKYMET